MRSTSRLADELRASRPSRKGWQGKLKHALEAGPGQGVVEADVLALPLHLAVNLVPAALVADAVALGLHMGPGGRAEQGRKVGRQAGTISGRKGYVNAHPSSLLTIYTQTRTHATLGQPPATRHPDPPRGRR